MYGKHFESMYTGSMFGAGFPLFAVWGYVISHAKDGMVELNPKVLAAVFGESDETIEQVLASLCEPDPDSRTPDEDGRKLVQMGHFAYRVVNHERYRKLRSEDERREYQREWDRKNRPSGYKRAKSYRKPEKVRPNPTNPTHTEAEAEAKAVKITALSKIVEEFEVQFWPNVPNKTGKGKACEAYIKARKNISAEVILAGLPKFQAYEEGRSSQNDYRPLLPATWLNQGRWADEVAHKETAAEKVARLKAKGLL